MSDGPRARLTALDCLHKRGTACVLLRQYDYCGDYPPRICPKMRDVPTVAPRVTISGEYVQIMGVGISEQAAEELATALLIAARQVRNG